MTELNRNIYMRQHSNFARKWTKDSLNSRLYMQEDPIVEVYYFNVKVRIYQFKVSLTYWTSFPQK